MDFDAALMLKEAQANAWERECRNAKNRADTAVRKSATDAQALESLKAELAACQTELAAVNGAPTASAAPTADPALAQRMKDLETELAVVSESHARLESELAETKALASRAEDLSEQLGTVEAELAALKLEPPPSPSGDLETLLQDLDTLTRERNQLAAEVASLKATGTRPDSV
jgi:chromosome segregation ATPase